VAVSSPSAPQPSVAVTCTVSWAGELVRSETTTLPLTLTLFASTWTRFTVGVPRVKLPCAFTNSTSTSPASSPHASLALPLNWTSNSHASSTSPPAVAIAAVGGLLNTTRAWSSTSKKMFPTDCSLIRASLPN
jgi:hypothetical protein